MNLRERFAEYKRVMQIARKPDKAEFTSTTKISFTSIALIGGIGFVIYLTFVLTGL
ncbi:MAG TPA: protein translocase SEC61 complex subunit gamma [archaeon]|nr:protein translocase SEC61 complex subunit gamma [archaeon]